MTLIFFKLFYVAIQKEIERKFKCVWADNCGEYRRPFVEYCKSHWIKFKKLVPKTPQYKRVAKGINHTINDKIRCMLSHAKLPKSFYGETMRIVVDFINLSPLVSLNIDVLERVCSWKNESYDFLRVFSYKAFIHMTQVM